MEEPKRKSFFDVVKYRLSLADRPEPVTRFVYVGSYKGSKDDLQSMMNNNVKELNDEFGKFTGLLLVYTGCVIHLIEASEEAIYRHLKFLANDKSVALRNNIIILPSQYFVYRMFFSDWHVAFLDDSPVLFDTIENNELDELCKQIKDCLFKMYSLSEYLMRHEKVGDILKNLNDAAPHLLPDVTMLEYLLSKASPKIRNLKMYLKEIDHCPFIHLYNESVWPPVWRFEPSLLHISDGI